MQRSLWTAGLVVVAIIGCGGEPEEPESNSEATPAVDAAQPADAPEVATLDNSDVIEEQPAEPFKIAVATQDEIEAADNGERLSDIEDGDEPGEETPVEDITSEGNAESPARYKFLTVDEGQEDAIPGFEWVDPDAAAKKEAEMKAQEEAEKQAGIEAAENDAALRAELEALKAAQEQAEQDRRIAEAAAEEARMQAEADALARKEAQEELERLRAEAEKARMAAEADAEKARAQAEAEALAKKEAEEELKRVQAETERQRMAAEAEAEEARKQAEAEAMAKKEAQEELVRVQAEAEAALIKAREEQKMAEAEAAAAAKAAEAGDTEAPAPAAPASDPVGTIKLAKLDLEAQHNGTNGVGLGSAAKVENLNGAKIELAAYFFDAKGNPLKDTDQINRSSRGQVYVGKESVVPSDEFDINDTLFIPFDQLELAAGQEHEVQVELVLWEYSQGRGKRLAVAPKATFRHAPAAKTQQVVAAAPSDISGTWRHEDSTITIIRQGDAVVLNGLGMVPYNILSEQWAYNDGTLTGTVVNKRNFPPMSRIWTFDMKMSPDGNSLTGTFHREDKKGNFAFDSEPFTWTRVD